LRVARRAGGSAALGVVLCCGSAFAAGGPATDAYDDIREGAALDVHGLGDLYLLYNFDDPVTGKNQLRAFDFQSHTPSLSYFRLTLAHRPGRVGFRLDVGVGDTADVYEEEDPAAAAHPHLARVMSYFEQAFVTVMVPLGREVQLDVGRFSTPVGMEDNESLRNWNYSRSLLFTWAEPTLHTGLRLSCQATRTLAVSAFWVNGWNSVFLDGSAMRSFGGAASWKPAPSVELVLVYMGGLERPPTQLSGPLSFRNVIDAYVVWEPVHGFTLALTVDYGNDRAGGGVNWWGLSGYAHVQARPWLAGTIRGEYLSDPDGFVTGTRQGVAELTATIELRLKTRKPLWVARVEARHDQSNARVFDGAAPASLSHQDTITLGLLTSC
jgi:hypothetical protein